MLCSLAALLLVSSASASQVNALRPRGGTVISKENALKTLTVAGTFYGGSCIFTPRDMLAKSGVATGPCEVSLQQGLGYGIVGLVASHIAALKGADGVTTSHTGILVAMSGWVFSNFVRMFGPNKEVTKTEGAKADFAICAVLITVLGLSTELP